MSHNFRSRNAKKPIKGYNDLNYSLVPVKLWVKKLGHWFDAQGPITSAKMCETTPIMTSPTKKTKTLAFLIKKIWTTKLRIYTNARSTPVSVYGSDVLYHKLKIVCLSPV